MAMSPQEQEATTLCCHLHREKGCCDPEDCGPCCGECPTCPTLVLSDVKIALLSLSWEFEGQRFGQPGYDMTGDHAYEVLTANAEKLSRLQEARR